MNATVVDRLLERVNAGENLSAAEITELASADILSVGMLADSLRRRLRGTQVTYVRVAACPFDGSFASAVPLTAREVRITGAPPTLDVARSAIQSAKAQASEGIESLGDLYVLADTNLAATDKAVSVCPVGVILKKRRGFATPIGQRTYDAQPISVVALAKPEET